MDDTKATKEISRQIEFYNFQVRGIAWQILITLFISVSVFFLGAQNYVFFFLFLLVSGVFFVIIVMDYLNIKYSVISRERGMSLEQLKYFRGLIRGGEYEEAIKFLRVVDKNAPGRDELVRKVKLIIQFESLIRAKKISWKELDNAARSRNYRISRNYMSGDYFTISVKELGAILKELK